MCKVQQKIRICFYVVVNVILNIVLAMALMLVQWYYFIVSCFFLNENALN